MTVLFIDGFDLNTHVVNDDLPGIGDSAFYYYTPPLNTRFYTTGYLKGQATILTMSSQLGGLTTSGYLTNSIPKTTTKVRICMWSKVTSVSSASKYIPFQAMNFPDAAGTGAVGVFLNGADRRFYFAYGNPYGNYPSPGSPPTIIGLAGSTTDLIGTDWVFYETVIDTVARTLAFYINGSQVNTALIPASVNLGSRMGLDIRNGIPHFQVDHVIVTDGDRPKNLDAVAVSVAMGHYNDFNRGGFKSKIVIHNTAYDLDPAFVGVSDGWGVGSFARVHHFLYNKNPETQAAWSAFSDIEAWGVCAVGVTGNGPIRLATLALSYIDCTSDPLGLPIINYRLPSTLTMWSGSWTKQNLEKTYGGNVSLVPRDAAVLADSDYLMATSDGCLLFPATSDGGDGVLQDLGLTFAQEFRTDYQDWDTLGGSLPFDSYFITGYSVMGEGNKEFQSNYVTVNYEELPVGQAYLQGLWDYALDGDTGRWSSKQPVYRFPGNYKHQMRKLKVRGGGKALQIKISSEDNKDYKINGWSIFATGDTAV